MGFFGIKRTLGKHDALLAELRDAHTVLARSMRDLQLDQDAIFDKTHRLFGRIAKRAAIDNPMEPIGKEIPTFEEAHIDEISAGILARRAIGLKK